MYEVGKRTVEWLVSASSHNCRAGHKVRKFLVGALRAEIALKEMGCLVDVICQKLSERARAGLSRKGWVAHNGEQRRKLGC